MAKPDYRSTAQGRGTHDRGGDSELLSDRIFANTGVQAEVRLQSQTRVALTVKDYADFLLARNYLCANGYPKENVTRSI